MRKGFKFIILAIALLSIVFVSVSCGGDESDGGVYTAIETPNLEYKDGAYTLTVSSEITTFDISSLFVISENATFLVSSSDSFDIPSGIEVSLTKGSNTYYVKVTDINRNEAVYKFIINKKEVCEITFNTNGGSEIPAIKCDSGTIIEAPVSVKTGYSLKWDYDFNQPITENITVNAEWTPNVYKVTVDGTDTVIEATYGQKISVPAFEKNGYQFLGWVTDGVKFDATAEYTIAKDITISPVLAAINYPINYITIGGVNSNPSTYTVEDEIVLSDLVWNAGENDKVIYEFAGWYKDADHSEKIEKITIGTTGAIDLYAKWDLKEVPEEKVQTSVTLNAGDYDCDGQTFTFTVGEEYTLPSLEKNGYNFAGWKTENGEVVVYAKGIWSIDLESVTLIPNWTTRNYSITYILNGGENNKDNILSYTILDTFAFLAPEKKYSTFDGWYLDESLETPYSEIVEGTYGDITVYAKWNVISYEVTLDANGGTVTSEKQTVILGDNYSLIEPTRLGYKFDGWFDGENQVELSGTWLTENNLTVVAKWSLETYTIEYELGEGKAEGLVESYNYESGDIKLPIPTSESKTFLGWSLNDGPIIKETIIRKNSVGNRKYIAHWCDEKAENGFLYSINGNTATVVGYDGVVGKSVVIPSEYNGFKVVAIGNNAFSGYGKELEKINSQSFTTFYLPQTIERIGANAFKECDDLKIQVSGIDSHFEKEALEAWISKLVVENGNDQVIDVIRAIRPAIGWRPYSLPQ